MTPNEDPILDMVDRERFVNDGSPTGLTWSHSSSAATCPRRSGPRFLVPTVRRSASESEMLGTLPDLFRSGDDVLVPIHPDCVHLLERSLHRRMLLEEGPHLTAIPTASPRTVYAQCGGWRGFVKLDYPHVLGRFARPLAGAKLFQGVWVSDHLRAREAHRHGVFHFAESAAVETAMEPGRRGGALFRNPSPTGGPFDTYVAFCSLFADDHFDPGSTAIILRLAHEHGGVAWIADHVILPLVRSLWTLVFDFGLWPEPHAQNIVLGLRSDGATGVIWRDCQGFCVEATAPADLTSRVQRILAGQSGIERRSYLYDTMLATYVLDPLIKAVDTAHPGARQALQSAVVDETRAFLRRYSGGDLLPRGQSYVMSLEAPQGRHLPFVPSNDLRYR
jgi:hypothetical protein